MASTKYTYSISNDFPNSTVNPAALSSQIQESVITRTLDYINTNDNDCDVWFTDTLTSGDVSVLDDVVSDHDGTALPVTEAPTMADGRPIIRAESRPLNYVTMFTMSGDTASGIGDGKDIFWDFSNDDDLVASGVAPDGYKRKLIDVTFLDAIFIKEGTNYFYGAQKGSYVSFTVVCPSGSYYIDRDGSPALATEDAIVTNYVNKHFFSGDCPMGDELNTESCTQDALPAGYKLRVEVTVPNSDNSSYGCGELEIYRTRTCLLPGESP
jgi:hypothetical protein